MHLLVVLVLVVGTFLYFPRLAQALVGLGLLGCLVVAGIVGYQMVEHIAVDSRVTHPTDAGERQGMLDFAFLRDHVSERTFSSDEAWCLAHGDRFPLTPRTQAACRKACEASFIQALERVERVVHEQSATLESRRLAKQADALARK